ncbi:hypothetical protein [Nostoc sp. FACHB-110]|uniref:hypothetical protein n=1 Tax=Nostoc sp. FACHB-110 TaxID=2692834 RepID=UPI001688C0ED|nr:hypothetical protein [Nostoc sp. FACHB-110]MBD2440558.1 hypothetical protein [Nostoc sp. FACHB-110]
MKAKGEIVAVSSYSSHKPKTQAQIFASIIGKWGRKYQHHLYATGTTLIVSSQTFPAQAFGLFNPTQLALACMFKSSGATGNTILSTLPGVINAAITVMLFVYFVASGVKVANAIGDGQEITQVIQQPVGIFFVTLILFIAQSILFSGVTESC